MRKLFKDGTPFVWLTGGALMFSLLMVVGVVMLIMVKGLVYFWPQDIALVHLSSGGVVMGRIVDEEDYTRPGAGEQSEEGVRIQLKIGNRDLNRLDFRWVDGAEVEDITYPPGAVAIERREWGDFYGTPRAFETGGVVVATEPGEIWRMIDEGLPLAHDTFERIKYIEKTEIGDINAEIEGMRLKIKSLAGDRDPAARERVEGYEAAIGAQEALYELKERELSLLYHELGEHAIVVEEAQGRSKTIPLGGIVRIYRPNDMGAPAKIALYFSKVGEFLFDYPRESNTEGGVFPAIFGTVMMVFIMSIAVMPLGVLAALYLREYARQGMVVRIVRICVNNLAGVPSIVFGVVGLGIFIYGFGGIIDSIFFGASLPAPTFGTGGILWASLTLAMLTLPVVIVATEEGLATVPREIRHGSLALGATRFETMWQVVIPSAMPGILTGLILAIARATGEVAPLMITGVVKLAPTLPIDGYFPYVHLERKFMHLGFHIYDVGFQSPNVEAAIPMLYATTLLLILIVVVLNLAAIFIRARLRSKYGVGEV